MQLPASRLALKLLPAAEKRVGLLVLSSDVTPERDLAQALAARGILTTVSKVRYVNPITPANLRDLGERLAVAADLFPEADALPLIAFCCTSASVELGDAAVVEMIRRSRPHAQVMTAAAASCSMLRSNGAKRVSLFTPYPAEVTKTVAEYIEAEGFEIAAVQSLNLDDDRIIARVDPAFIQDWVCESFSRAADAVFVSCTALRAFEVAERIEQKLARPVVTSNRALSAAIVGHFTT